MKPSPAHLCFFLDANCVNAKQLNEHLNELEQLRQDGLITLIYSDAAFNEAEFRNTLRAEKAAGFSYTSIEPEFGENPEVKAAIEAVLFPDGPKFQNHRNDVLAVYHAERLQWPLITMDGASRTQPGGILGRAAELRTLGVEVITPAEAVARVRAQREHAA